MADPHAPNYLGYGTPGTTHYDPNLQEWTFLRQIGYSASNDPDRGSEPVLHNIPTQWFGVDPPMGGPSPSLSSHGPTSVSSKDIKSLKKALPELAPITRHMEFRKHFAEVPKSLFPQTRDLLAFGNALQLSGDDPARKPQITPIVVHAYGEAGDVLRIARLIKRSPALLVEEDNLKSSRLSTIDTRDVASWKGTNGPIQQIRSAESRKDGGAWIAVRFNAATTFCAPRVHSRLMPARATSHSIDDYKFPPSTLDANPFVSLPIARTGGSPHADVDFNPEDNSQVAVVDERGTWSIWQLQDPSHNSVGDPQRIQLLVSGKLSPEKPQRNVLGASLWHSICWLGKGQNNLDRILVCSRRKIALFDIEGRILPTIEIDLGTLRDQQIILNMQRIHRDPDQCFILTNTHIIWLASNVPSFLVQNSPPKDLEVILSWRHFLNTEDTSLYLNTLKSASGTLVFVSSLLTPLTLVFQFGELDELPAPLSMADPAPILLHSPTNSFKGQRWERHLPARIHLDSFGFGSQVEPGYSQDLRLFKVYIVHADFSICEYILHFSNQNAVATGVFLSVYEDSTSSRLQSTQKEDTNSETMDKFVVEDNEDSTFQITTPFDELTCLTNKGKVIRQARATWHTDHADIYQIVAGQDAPSQSLDVVAGPPFPFTDFLEKARSDLFSPSLMKEHPAPLISELTELHPVIDGIEKESRKLDRLLEQIRDNAAQSVSLVTAGTGASQPLRSLSDTYDEVVRSFLGSLTPETPGQLRVSKEHACREVSAQLMLSNYALYAKYKASQTDDAPWQQGNKSAPNPLPSLPPVPAFPQQSQDFPTIRRATESAVQRLRAFSSVEVSSPTVNEKLVSEILVHLPTSPSASPKDYSYHKANDQVDASRMADQATSIDPKARRKAEQALQIHKRKMEKLNSQLAESSQRVPPTVMSSQLDEQDAISRQEDNRQGKSSQAMQNVAFGKLDEGKTSVVPVLESQPVTGAFGRRNFPSKVRGASKRKSGF